MSYIYVPHISHIYFIYNSDMCHIYSIYNHKHICAIYVTYMSHDFIYVPYVLSLFRILGAFIYVAYMCHISIINECTQCFKYTWSARRLYVLSDKPANQCFLRQLMPHLLPEWVNFCCLTWTAANLGPVNPWLHWNVRCINSSDRFALPRESGLRGFKFSLGICVTRLTSFIAVYDWFMFFSVVTFKKKSEHCKTANKKQCLKPPKLEENIFCLLKEMAGVARHPDSSRK